MKKNNNAFTLVELSIVLIVIGLLLAGIFGGRALIYSAKLKGTIKEITDTLDVVDKFKVQYGSLPGDLPDAFAVFGAVNCPDDDAPTGCNGNENGFIDSPDEIYRAWQHLQLSNIIDDSYPGIGDQIPQHTVSAGNNVPRLEYYDSAAFVLFQQNLFILSPNDVNMGMQENIGGNIDAWAVIPVRDAFYIDQKIDNGRPGTGMIMADVDIGLTTVTNCAISTQISTGTSAASGEYDISNESNSCILSVKLQTN